MALPPGHARCAVVAAFGDIATVVQAGIDALALPVQAGIDAMDAVQDAMMKMLVYRERPATEWTPLFWSILRRRIIDLQRRARFRLSWLRPAGASEVPEESSIDWADPGAGPARAHEQREAYARLVLALRALPARQREAFTLRVLEELDVATTARAMGCSEGSVKTHLSRARQALHSQLEDVL